MSVNPLSKSNERKVWSEALYSTVQGEVPRRRTRHINRYIEFEPLGTAAEIFALSRNGVSRHALIKHGDDIIFNLAKVSTHGKQDIRPGICDSGIKITTLSCVKHFSDYLIFVKARSEF